MSRAGVLRDRLINYPVSLAALTKLSGSCRMMAEREMAALRAIDRIERGGSAEHEVVAV